MDQHLQFRRPKSGDWILAIDTSTPDGSVTLFSPEEHIFRYETLTEKIRTSKILLPTILDLHGKMKAEKDNIMAVGVALGPGSFTGLRIGVATAKGLALGLKCPLFGISSLKALAVAATYAFRDHSQPLPTWMMVYRDAHHGELFTAPFGPWEDSSSLFPPRAGGDQVGPPEAVSFPEEGTVLLAGRKRDLPAGWSPDVLGERFSSLDISSASDGVARLVWQAIQQGEAPAGPDLRPIYGRRPRAETQWSDAEG